MLTGEGLWIPANHLSLLNDYLQLLAGRAVTRLITTMGPRHGKSELGTVNFSAWWLGTFPDDRVMLAAYQAGFAASFGRKARDIIERYGDELWGIRVNPQSSASGDWNIQRRQGNAWVNTRGGMIATGVGAALTGMGADLLIVDDPIRNAQDAHSQVYRDKMWEWWKSTARTRLEPEGVVSIILTRWHEDDLAGRIIKEQQERDKGLLIVGDEGRVDRFEVLNLPAICDEPQVDPLHRQFGEALWPERWPAWKLRPLMDDTYWWNAMYMGRPAPIEGALFKRERFRYFTVRTDTAGNQWFALWPKDGSEPRLVPAREGVSFATVDLASSLRTSADFTCVMIFRLLADSTLLVLDVVRERMENPDLYPLLSTLAQRWGLAEIGIEAVQFQLAAIQIARRRGLPIKELRPKGDKYARAMPAAGIATDIAFDPSMGMTSAARVAGGGIYFMAGAPYLLDLESELLTFPHGSHDDQVDCLAYGAVLAQKGRTTIKVM